MPTFSFDIKCKQCCMQPDHIIFTYTETHKRIWNDAVRHTPIPVFGSRVFGYNLCKAHYMWIVWCLRQRLDAFDSFWIRVVSPLDFTNAIGRIQSNTLFFSPVNTTSIRMEHFMVVWLQNTSKWMRATIHFIWTEECPLRNLLLTGNSLCCFIEHFGTLMLRFYSLFS